MESSGKGSIYTPPEVAQFLVTWAISDPDDIVLDLGVGEGAFTFAAYDRLVSVGANSDSAQQQIFGAEIETSTFERFESAAKKRHLQFPYVQNMDFFDYQYPTPSVIVGNPPYVRRTYLKNLDPIRAKLSMARDFDSDTTLSRMSDLYVYFLLLSFSMLKPSGKVAVITADSWMTVGYGQRLRNYLLQHFRLDRMISLDRRVFDDAQVKPIMLFATKKESADTRPYETQFVRVKNGLTIPEIESRLNSTSSPDNDIIVLSINTGKLSSSQPWSIHLKAPEIYEKLASTPIMMPISQLAVTRIGEQTLAKEFFVLSAQRAQELKIEMEFLRPLAQSIKYYSKPIIDPGDSPKFYIFYCSKQKLQLEGTNALIYIENAERAEVKVRGKNQTVIGFHNKERIRASGRALWYDVRSSLERRGTARILIPRLVYRYFSVIWNRAEHVPGELFIEFMPKYEIEDEVVLAILTSSITEIMLRAHAQIYGGGTYNINPGEIKNVPIVDYRKLSSDDKAELVLAYRAYLKEPNDRVLLDLVLLRLLGFGTDLQPEIRRVLEDMHMLAAAAKEFPLDNPQPI